MKLKILYILLISFSIVWGQENEQLKDSPTQKEVKALIKKGISAYNSAEYEAAETDFRKAFALDPVNATASYNLGLTMTETQRNMEGERFFEKAGKQSENSLIKDKAFFNAGNVWLGKKKYEKAIEAYKNALRNNPADEEARYNLALAMKMLKKQQKNNKNNKNKNKNKNQNKKQNKDQKNKDKNKQNKDQNKNKKDNKNKKNKNKKDNKGNKKKDNKQQQNKQKQQNKQGKGDKKKQEKKQGQKPKSKLSPQQIKQLLIGLKNKEKKMQKKIAVKKMKGKGKRKKTDKDW